VVNVALPAILREFGDGIALLGTFFGGQLDRAGPFRGVVGTAALLALGGVVSFVGIRSARATVVTPLRRNRIVTASPSRRRAEQEYGHMLVRPDRRAPTPKDPSRRGAQP
jgi:hypothetical protein